ncbi:hypothetical protein SBF1_9700001 [Candidatus Desulfosporosinus infrequens]|uniref:Uncharacterized protein n=1 Tax=Candidatus Desulfosporosinus infrequens TaxID=2043169 RepID=A0A2U3LYI9_9FIRM|nr:hypothetical protein SBF1_9700001 [Candidatus Desulfosporosinus infrequens]
MFAANTETTLGSQAKEVPPQYTTSVTDMNTPEGVMAALIILSEVAMLLSYKEDL